MTFYDYMEEKHRRSEEERKRLGWGGRYNWGQEGYTLPESEEIGNLHKVMALREAEPTDPYTMELTEKRLAEVAAGKRERPIGVEDVEVYHGGVQTAGPGYTPEAEAIEYARRMTKTINRYDETGKVIGTVEVPDWEKRAEGVMKPKLTAAETAQKGGQASLFEGQASVVQALANSNIALESAQAQELLGRHANAIRVAKIHAETILGKGSDAAIAYNKEIADVWNDTGIKKADVLKNEKFNNASWRGGGLTGAGKVAIENLDTLAKQRIADIDRRYGITTRGPLGVKEGSTATNPKTGQKLIYRGGKWQPL